MNTTRWTISFPIWGIFDMNAGGAYHDPERFVREHAERNFNCIRLEGGAGLGYDAAGNRRGPLRIVEPFPGHTGIIRQSWDFGGAGVCDLSERLFALLEAGKKYNVQFVLSSWYYLHTCWYCGDEALNRELHALPPHERFGYFGRALDCLLCAIEARGLEGQIAFAEILNEADGLPFVDGYDRARGIGTAEKHAFRRDHETALAELRNRHPEIAFAADTYTAWTDPELLPRNAQFWNFHNYFAWSAYAPLENRLLKAGTDVTAPAELGNTARWLRNTPYPLESLRALRAGKIAAPEDWYRRVWLYDNLDPARLPEIETALTAAFRANRAAFRDKFEENLAHVLELRRTHCPDAELVTGEGFTWSGRRDLLWEERCDEIWELVGYTMRRYREAGLRGAAMRTCMGPEDPAWNLRKNDIAAINAEFLKD